MKGKIDELCVNALRMLAIDAVDRAKSGHPGMPLGAAPMAYALWTGFLRHNPANPAWFGRDRFILSAGHGSALLYALLNLSGHDLSMEEIKNFRQYGSRTPGHPERCAGCGIEVTTGPLGQGFAMGVGMAMAERFMAARYNRPGLNVIDHHTCSIISDGDLMEGVSSEAASIAGHLKLGKLIYLYDDNHISIEGSTDLAFSEDVLRRFDACGWHTERVKDGNDLAAIAKAIGRARAEGERPSLIAVRTHIGFGSPKHDTASAHGEPLGAEANRATREFFGWQRAPFEVPEEVRGRFAKAAEEGARREGEWNGLMQRYREKHPEDAARLDDEIAGRLPAGWEEVLPAFEAGKAVATRAASGKAINALARALPNLIGGSADLGPSNKSTIDGGGDFEAANHAGRNIHFGVREHAMGAIVNGLAVHGGIIPFGATFLVFSDYMRPSIRIAALMQSRSIFVFTHDSLGIGEDGPTHQPIEHLASLRAMPGIVVIRPADANETAAAWRWAISSGRPVALALSRQNLPVLDRDAVERAGGVERGAYVLSECEGEPDAIIIATGSEVHLALEAQCWLLSEHIPVRVVSMPSWELFEEQPEGYRDSVLPPSVKARVAVEAGATFGWSRWVGESGRVVGVDRFGASAPGEVAMERLGITADAVIRAVKEIL
ncbi:MAG: transketolase [Proteobacteria bacterium]|nr:transketolase [Pseudomonadota bacterium]